MLKEFMMILVANVFCAVVMVTIIFEISPRGFF